MDRKLVNGCIAATVGGILAVSIFWVLGCTFYVGPKLFDAYVESEGKLVAEPPEACRDVDSRALGTLSALLATLVALRQRGE